METTPSSPKCSASNPFSGMLKWIIETNLTIEQGSRSCNASTLNELCSPTQTSQAQTCARLTSKRPIVAEVSTSCCLKELADLLTIYQSVVSKSKFVRNKLPRSNSTDSQDAGIKSHRGTHKTNCVFSFNQVSQADLREAELKDCHFTSCDLREAKLDWVWYVPHWRRLIDRSNAPR